jgi:hypothetical protein
VNNGEKVASSVISDAGIGRLAPASIGGDPFHRRFCKHRRCSRRDPRRPGTPKSPQLTRRVAAAPAPTGKPGPAPVAGEPGLVPDCTDTERPGR